MFTQKLGVRLGRHEIEDLMEYMQAKSDDARSSHVDYQ